MKKKMMKAIKELNAYIDNDRQELCDELHEIKLSHKRLEKLLEQCLYYLNRDVNGVMFSIEFEEKLIKKIKNELAYPYLRRNWGYTHKQEPGHYCE